MCVMFLNTHREGKDRPTLPSPVVVDFLDKVQLVCCGVDTGPGWLGPQCRILVHCQVMVATVTVSICSVCVCVCVCVCVRVHER